VCGTDWPNEVGIVPPCEAFSRRVTVDVNGPKQWAIGQLPGSAVGARIADQSKLQRMLSPTSPGNSSTDEMMPSIVATNMGTFYR
jgi:hypothetical protein